MEPASAYIPIDRRQAIARNEDLPDRTHGAALFADVSGFTPLTETLVRELGPRRGAEELTRHLNAVYGALIAEVHRCGGSVVSFAGDAITCWFDGDAGLHATACALTMQDAMGQFADLETRSGSHVSLAIKVAVVAGPVRRFLVGDPGVQLLDALAGSTLDRMARAEKHADRHEVVVGSGVVQCLGERVAVSEWREDEETGERYAVVGGWAQGEGLAFPERGDPPALGEGQIRPWILEPVYERLRAGQERFLAELRPAVALFLRFGGLDFDEDERAGDRLDSYVRWVQGVLGEYEGHLLQLIVGDKGIYLYAAFGAPLAHDDDAARAVAAAIGLLSPPEALSYIGAVQIGVSQGQMRAGAYGGPGRRTYGVLGDEVTAAARLMQTAEPGQALVSSRVADAAGRHYAFEYLGEVHLKGKALPMPAYAPTGRRTLPGEMAASHPYPLVGRDAELARLQDALGWASEGRGQVLRIQGAAGVGKSRLAAELVEAATGLGARAAMGACQSTTQGIAYAPWNQVFRILLGLVEGAPQADDLDAQNRQQIANLTETIGEANPDWLLRLPLLGDLMDLPIPDNETTAAFDPQLRQESLLSLAIEIVRAWASRSPVIVLVEDAHWMDEASQRLVVALSRAIADAAVLLLVVQRDRPAGDGVLLPDLESLPHFSLVDLDVLRQQGVAALVASRLRGEPSKLLLSLIEAQAQGNPLFTEELVDTLRESQRIHRQDGMWALSEEMLKTLRAANCLSRDVVSGEWTLVESAQLLAADLGIPDSVHGIVLSRIDRLPERPKLTLKVASVIGRTFELDLLTSAHPLHPERSTVAAEMGMLERQGFARLDAPRVLPVYEFGHNITQEVVYQTLLEDQQRELHQSVGEALEEMLPDAVERLAYHYSRTDVRDKALLYLGQAAERTQRGYANETALNYYDQALALEERWQWRRGQVQVLHILGRREGEETALRVLDAATEAPVFEVAYLWGQYYEALGDYVQAQGAIERAMAACRECGDTLGQARALAQLGLIARRQGDYEGAKERYNEALALFAERESYSDSEAQALAQALNGLGTVHRQMGSFEEAKACCERALVLSRGHGNRMGEVKALSNLGGTAYYRRDFAEALDYYRRALEVCRVIGDRGGEGMSLYNLGISAYEVGDYSRAELHFSDALTIHQAVGDRWEEANVWMGLGLLYRELGDLSRAQDCLAQGLGLDQEIGDEGGQVYMLSNLGLVLRDRGDLEMAEQLLEESLTLARRQKDAYQESFSLSYLGTVSLLAGRLDQGIQRSRAALAMRQELGLRPATADDLATLAAAHSAVGDREQALACAQQALDVLEECGSEGPDFPQRDYFVCYQVLAEAGQHESARAALRSAYGLVVARADRMTDPVLRRSYLEHVPINRLVVEEAARTGISQ